MKDPQRIVDEIRAFLQASDQSYKPQMKELGGEYAEACAEVNRRLARCAQLIKQGLRAEAIHQAETAPNLLAALGELDFGDRAAWLDLVGIYNLPSPPDLDMANAEHLNAAYVEHDPLKNLMKKHRRLALARAPLRDRLAVLREFARRDPTSPIWAEDVKSYELERFKQMQAEATDAVRRGDALAAEVLEHELDGVTWSTPPAGDLVRTVRRASETLRQQAARRALPEAEERLNAAFSALDPAQGRAARASWMALTEAAGLSSNDPARERAQPALSWLDDQDRREAIRAEADAAATELVEAIDDPTAPRTELEDLWQALKKLNPDVPRPLAQKYEQRIAGFDRARKLRTRLIAGSSAAAAVVLLVVAAAVYIFNARAQEQLAAVTSIRAALDGGRIDELEPLLKRMKAKQSGVYNSPDVQSLLPEVKRLRDVETERRGKFTRLKSDAETAPLTGAEPESLKEARKLARTTREKNDIEELARQIVQRNTDEADRRAGEVTPVLEELERTVVDIDRSLRDTPGGDLELSKRIDAAVRQLDEAAPSSGGPLSGPIQARVEKLRGRLTAVRQKAVLASRRGEAAEALTLAVGQLPRGVDGYVGAAKKLKAEYGQELQVADIDKLLGDPERSIWESALRWSAQASEWAASTTRLSGEDAHARIETCRTFLRKYPRCPDAPAVQSYMGYLKWIAARHEPNGGLVVKLKRFLTSPTMKDVYMIRYKTFPGDEVGGLKYYTRTPPKSTGTIKVACLLDMEGTTKDRTLESSFIVGPRNPSPQSKQAQRITVALDAPLAEANWDSILLDAARGVAEDADMDPICKLWFLNELLKTAVDGSQALREALGPTGEKMTKVAEFRAVPWLDPTTKVDEKRYEADRILKSLPSWEQVAAAANEANLRLLRSVGETSRPIGWISRKPQGFSLHLVDSKTNAKDLTLFVAAPEKGSGVWKPLGHVLNDAGDLVPHDAGLGAEGRLVFIRPAASAAGTNKTRSSDQ